MKVLWIHSEEGDSRWEEVESAELAIRQLVLDGFRGNVYCNGALLLAGCSTLPFPANTDGSKARKPKDYLAMPAPQPAIEKPSQARSAPATVLAEDIEILPPQSLVPTAPAVLKQAHADAVDMIKSVSDRTIDIMVRQFEIQQAQISDNLNRSIQDRLHLAESRGVERSFEEADKVGNAVAELQAASPRPPPQAIQKHQQQANTPRQPSLWARALANLYDAFQVR